MTTFSVVTRDELWSLDRHTLLESRLTHGSADERGATIDARDDCDARLLETCDQQSREMRDALRGLSEGRARFVVSARSDEPAVATTSITVLDLSIVTTLEHLLSDYEMLIEIASVRPEAVYAAGDLPVVWRNGSAAVLLHEAAGHPAEHGHRKVDWPPWLSATDESASGRADLLAGEPPRANRRQSFSDVPLRRMTSVVVKSNAQDVQLPARRIDVLLVAGGRYEPLTEEVSLAIAAADLVEGERAARVRPFVIRASRDAVARAIRGSAGPVRRYPGVICSREGQEIFVGSHAPDLVTEF